MTRLERSITDDGRLVFCGLMMGTVTENPLMQCPECLSYRVTDYKCDECDDDLRIEPEPNYDALARKAAKRYRYPPTKTEQERRQEEEKQRRLALAAERITKRQALEEKIRKTNEELERLRIAAARERAWQEYKTKAKPRLEDELKTLLDRWQCVNCGQYAHYRITAIRHIKRPVTNLMRSFENIFGGNQEYCAARYIRKAICPECSTTRRSYYDDGQSDWYVEAQEGDLTEMRDGVKRINEILKMLNYINTQP